MTESLSRYTLIAIACLAIVSAVLPWYADHLGNQSLRRAEQGWSVESLDLARKAVAYDPLSVDALFILAGAQQRLGRSAEARSSLNRAVELQPDNYITWEQLAHYERTYWGEVDAARAHLDRAAGLNPFDERLRRPDAPCASCSSSPPASR